MLRFGPNGPIVVGMTTNTTAADRLTLSEAAEFLRVSRKQVTRLIAGGRLAEIRLSRKNRFIERAELERFIEACRVGGAA